MPFALSGKLATTIRLRVPRYGVATAAEVQLADASILSGPAVLQVGDLALSGVIDPGGGPVGGISRYSWTAGKGLWSKVLEPWAFGSPIGVLRSYVLQKLLADTGEPGLIALPELRIGPHYVRARGEAWLTFQALGVPWWVDPSGVTQIGPRNGVEVSADAALVSWDREHGRRVLAPPGEGVRAWLPGNLLGGEVITSLEVEALPEMPLRLVVTTDGSDEIRSLFDAAFAQNVAQVRQGCSIVEYRVKAKFGNAYDLVPVREESGAPDLPKVEIWPGAAGHGADLRGPTDPGGATSVIVGFLDASNTRPVILGFLPAHRNGGLPVVARLNGDRVDLGDATKLVARQADPVNNGGIIVATAPGGIVTMTIIDNDGHQLAVTLAPGSSAVPPNAIVPMNGKIGLPDQVKVYA